MAITFSNSYKQVQQLLQQEMLEPALGWGLRMGIAMLAPIIWGISTGHPEAVRWMSLTANCLCWIPMKGNLGQRLGVLTAGCFLSVFFALLGSFTGNSIWQSVVCMTLVGFFCTLFKNLGDRGASLATSVFVLFLITNAFPANNTAEVNERIVWVVAGGLWAVFLSLIATVFQPVQQPYRRSIAVVWRTNAALTAIVGKGWDGTEIRSNVREIYQAEKAVRIAMDQSFVFHNNMAHQVSKKDNDEYELARVRKAAALFATHISAINDELENLKLQQIEMPLRVKLHDVFKMLQQLAERMSVFVLVLRSEDALLVRSRMTMLTTVTNVLRDYSMQQSPELEKSLRRIVQLSERIFKLMEKSVERLEKLDNQPELRTYSLFRTTQALHPKHLIDNLKQLFYLNSHTMRYALRTALVAGLTVFISKWFEIDHGYWLSFTVIIVMQPHFGATYKKAIDRIAGTLLGGIAGGLLRHVPTGLHIKEIMLFVSAVLMVYFFRTRYAIAVFFITLNVVLLFDVSAALNYHLLWSRALCTLAGSAMAVGAGYGLLPAWDKKWLPRHLAAALHKNYDYFIATFLTQQTDKSWTRYKRAAESENSNAFDSFDRYLQEPGSNKKSYSIYYQFLIHNVRLTRELNNIQLEQDNKDKTIDPPPTPEQQALVNDCLSWLNKIALEVASLYVREEIELVEPKATNQLSFCLSRNQVVYLEKLLMEVKGLYHNLEELDAERHTGHH